MLHAEVPVGSVFNAVNESSLINRVKIIRFSNDESICVVVAGIHTGCLYLIKTDILLDENRWTRIR